MFVYLGKSSLCTSLPESHAVNFWVILHLWQLKGHPQKIQIRDRYEEVKSGLKESIGIGGYDWIPG